MLQASCVVVRKVGGCVSIKMSLQYDRSERCVVFLLTGDFDDAELSDGEQSQVCLHFLPSLSHSQFFFPQYVSEKTNVKDRIIKKACVYSLPTIFNPGLA